MTASKLKSDADSSQGTSKRRRLKQKLASRTRSHGKLGIGSEGHYVKCSKKKKKRESREQGGTNASKGDSAHDIFQLYEDKYPNMRRLPKASCSAQQRTKGSFKLTDVKGSTHMYPSVAAIMKLLHQKRAEMALKFYEKNQGEEFEIVEVLEFNGMNVEHPNYNISNLWLHISFTAKSKNDGSTKHFFGELYRDDQSRKYYATYCDTFQPSDDPGFEYDCILCPSRLKCHPADGYLVGRPPWFVPYVRFG